MLFYIVQEEVVVKSSANEVLPRQMSLPSYAIEQSLFQHMVWATITYSMIAFVSYTL